MHQKNFSMWLKLCCKYEYYAKFGNSSMAFKFDVSVAKKLKLKLESFGANFYVCRS